jgi:hypothetical protein
MIRPLAWTALLLLLTCPPAFAADSAAPQAAPQIVPPVIDPLPILVRPAMLGDFIGAFAGHQVRVESARVVRLYGNRALLVETAARFRSARPTRILVLLDVGSMRVPANQLVGETVRVLGVARTLLGMQVTGEVPWPDGLDRGRARRLEIRGAVLASSVQTQEGIELTNRAL